MTDAEKEKSLKSARDKFLGLSLQSTRKSYYPQLKEQLELSKENGRRLELLLDSIPARIAYVDQYERYVFVNRIYEKNYGLPREKIVGLQVASLLGKEGYAKVKEYVRLALGGALVHFETTFKESNDRIQWLDVTYVPDITINGAVDGFYVLAVDMTDKKRAEEEKLKFETTLRQIQKREAIGTLAGGIAHDFNNLLMGIQGRASLISVDLEDSHPHMEHLRAMEEYIRSAMHLTKQLLGFARGGKYEVKPVDINELILNCATMFGRTNKEIALHKKLASAELVADVDRRQIEQVLLNMFVNAWQAMPDGGELYLETCRVDLTRAFCQPRGVKSGPYVKVTVTDTGCGMDEATRQRVFDPFFTTKEKIRGTGLGLASAYGIIQNHGGMITVYSEVGHGSTFNIYLPLSEKTAQRESHAKDNIVKGSETILLVDDEDMIIDVGQAILEKLGYRPIIANSGEQAIEAVCASDTRIDLVILDLIMPGMDGGRTFDRIRAIKPDLPVLLSSGYAINGKADDIMRRGCNGFIQKPFNIAELSQKIRSILD